MKKEYMVEQDNAHLSAMGAEIFMSTSRKKGIYVAHAHMHTALEFLYILHGSFRIEADGEYFIANPKDFVFFRPNTIHQIFSLDSGVTDYLVLKIRPDMILDFAGRDTGVLYVMQLCHRHDKTVWTKEETEKNGLREILERLLSDYTTPLYATELSLKANSVLLLTALLRNQPENMQQKDAVTLSALQQIYQAINIINSRYDENLTAKAVALEVDMSYTYFSRRFKTITGKSFTRYLNEVRVNHAEKTLLLTDKSVTEVAYASGFNDASYFISQYKKLRGKTPYKLKTEN
ncbi:MAG: helix-turn-helix domain-containing protein [Clostridia bacterium]|nr:helix-turn-helix domain-containing protein [Clostridia bacterium]